MGFVVDVVELDTQGVGASRLAREMRHSYPQNRLLSNGKLRASCTGLACGLFLLSSLYGFAADPTRVTSSDAERKVIEQVSPPWSSVGRQPKTHLQHVYVKIGISKQTALMNLLAPHLSEQHRVLMPFRLITQL